MRTPWSGARAQRQKNFPRRVFNGISRHHPNNKERLCVVCTVPIFRNLQTDFDETLYAQYTLPKDDVRSKKYSISRKNFFENFQKNYAKV